MQYRTLNEKAQAKFLLPLARPAGTRHPAEHQVPAGRRAGFAARASPAGSSGVGEKKREKADEGEG
jgi:hypothetical protein